MSDTLDDIIAQMKLAKPTTSGRSQLKFSTCNGEHRTQYPVNFSACRSSAAMPSSSLIRRLMPSTMAGEPQT
jgi:hypothetical protein